LPLVWKCVMTDIDVRVTISISIQLIQSKHAYIR
jgi:hypothetical protein